MNSKIVEGSMVFCDTIVDGSGILLATEISQKTVIIF